MVERHVANVNVGGSNPLTRFPTLVPDPGLSPVFPGEETPLHGGVFHWRYAVGRRYSLSCLNPPKVSLGPMTSEPPQASGLNFAYLDDRFRARSCGAVLLDSATQ